MLICFQINLRTLEICSKLKIFYPRPHHLNVFGGFLPIKMLTDNRRLSAFIEKKTEINFRFIVDKVLSIKMFISSQFLFFVAFFLLFFAPICLSFDQVRMGGCVCGKMFV